jgi:3-hydroxyisobutyrate dehydrogenase-like beta-hydroxyacid dehydrogenase
MEPRRAAGLSSEAIMRVAFLGLGRMGSAMARRLVADFDLTVFNRDSAKAAPFSTLGARVAGSVREAVAGAEVAITMLADDAAEESLAFGPGGLLGALAPGAVHVAMSTIGVATSDRLAVAHAAAGQGYVAAPVFGRPPAAEAGQLWILAAGPEAQVARCQPVFSKLGQGVFPLGERAAAAHALKLAGNTLLVTVLEALSEAFAYGEKAGIAPETTLKVLNTALLKSPLAEAYGGAVVRGVFEPAGFALRLGLKDVSLALDAAGILQAPLPLAGLLRDRLQEAMARIWRRCPLSAARRRGSHETGLDHGLSLSGLTHTRRAAPEGDHSPLDAFRRSASSSSSFMRSSWASSFSRTLRQLPKPMATPPRMMPATGTM